MRDQSTAVQPADSESSSLLAGFFRYELSPGFSSWPPFSQLVVWLDGFGSFPFFWNLNGKLQRLAAGPQLLHSMVPFSQRGNPRVSVRLSFGLEVARSSLSNAGCGRKSQCDQGPPEWRVSLWGMLRDLCVKNRHPKWKPGKAAAPSGLILTHTHLFVWGTAFGVFFWVLNREGHTGTRHEPEAPVNM